MEGPINKKQNSTVERRMVNIAGEDGDRTCACGQPSDLQWIYTALQELGLSPDMAAPSTKPHRRQHQPSSTIGMQNQPFLSLSTEITFVKFEGMD